MAGRGWIIAGRSDILFACGQALSSCPFERPVAKVVAMPIARSRFRRTRRSMAGLAMLVVLGSFWTAAAKAAEDRPERRVALVIGNADYETAVPLDNPLHDAEAMA